MSNLKRTLFWMTGCLAFLISPLADNLTTALILCAVILTVGGDQPGFVPVACTNIVVAANAGGAFSPFGDITTLMVWQKGIIEFGGFFALFLPALINFLVPAFIMQWAIPTTNPVAQSADVSPLKKGGMVILVLFLLTITTAVSVHNWLHIPPVFGMMMGLAYLKFYGYYLHLHSQGRSSHLEGPPGSGTDPNDFDVFARIAGALALVGANVVDARSYTTKDGYVTDAFWIQDSDGHPYEADRLARLTKMIHRTLKGELVASDAFKSRDKIKKRLKAFNVPTHISFDNEGSDIYTIIEVDTRDRPGLLYDLTRTLANANIYIANAVIATYGEQAVDSFYVKDMFGLKYYSEAKQRSLEAKLRKAIADGSDRADT